jgi:uncharacterized repeat protein (TIGR03803 family)
MKYVAQTLQWILRRTISALLLTILLGIAVIASPSAQGQTLTVLFSFKGGKNGSGPIGGVVRDPAGNIYGTTFQGGDLTCDVDGCGTVFHLYPTGKKNVPHRFTGGDDGQFPEAPLLLDPAGKVYGTAGCSVNSGGAVFKVAPGGRFTILHVFGGPGDGICPDEALVQDSAGNLYGITVLGGIFNHGSVFKISPSGNEEVLYSFTGGADGDGPQTGLVQDSAGNFYGGTIAGGASGLGTVFKLTRDGVVKVLYNFVAGDGFLAPQTLVLDSAGRLYGTTTTGGSGPCTGGCGTVFKLTKKGIKIVLHSFAGSPDGVEPLSGLVMDAAGNFYGTTVAGGTGQACSSSGCGTVYKIDKKGNETVLFSFDGITQPIAPFSGVVLDPAGNLYGTTFEGGAFGYGAVYRLNP